jgi:hypothetical protein
VQVAVEQGVITARAGVNGGTRPPSGVRQQYAGARSARVIESGQAAVVLDRLANSVATSPYAAGGALIGVALYFNARRQRMGSRHPGGLIVDVLITAAGLGAVYAVWR